MHNITNGLSSSFLFHPNTIYFHDDNTDSVFRYEAPKDSETGYLRDYTLVTKIPGPNKNNIILFSSTHNIGHILTVSNFVKVEFLKSFEKVFESNQADEYYFKVIFEVEGFERTGFYPTMKHIKSGSNKHIFTG